MFHNNAGVLGLRTPLLDFTDDSYRDVFDVNVFGMPLGLQVVAKAVIALSSGSIVNTASEWCIGRAGSYGTHYDPLPMALWTSMRSGIGRLLLNCAIALSASRSWPKMSRIWWFGCSGPPRR